MTDTPGVQRTILYIEDNPATVRLVERLLEQRPGVRLISADSGQLGLALAREHRPNLILLDLHLPDMRGSAVLRAIHQDPLLRQTPVIVLSGDPDPDLPTQTLPGAQGYLLKPFDSHRFFTAIDASLASGGRSDPTS
jgi:CheY-like chemotaxis protein